jgi:hypothetical protein
MVKGFSQFVNEMFAVKVKDMKHTPSSMRQLGLTDKDLDAGEVSMKDPRIDHEAHHENSHYMFFGNLETLKNAIDSMLKMDPKKVAELLKNGHDWAADHVATSKDDVEEVYNFLRNEMAEEVDLTEDNEEE